MYLEHFGLSRPPFKITPDTSLFFEGSQRGAALGALIYAIKNGEGIIKVVGEVGSGKTMICRMLEVKLTGELDIVYIANPSLSPDNILHVIAHELELEVTTDASKLEVMQKIQAYLLQKHSDNRQVVMFVEEAQSMPVETLEEIRLLSNLETDQNKLLQMVLFGQPELDEKLSQNSIRQLKERITHSFYLDPFPPSDTLEYLNFRMRAVGYRGPDIFNHKTAGTVKKYSNGLTRRINILADKSLMATFSEGKHQVAVKHVKIAARDSEFEKVGNNKNIIYGALILTSLIVAVWMGTQISNISAALNLQSNNQLSVNNTQAATAILQPNSPVVATSVGDSQVLSSDEGEAMVKVSHKSSATVVSPEKVESQPEVTSKISEVALKLEPKVSPASSTESLLDNRLEATDKWLATIEDKKYSVQLFLSRKKGHAAIEEFLHNVPESLDFNKIYIYETLINKEAMYSVIYDDFTSFSKAVEVINGISNDFQINKPFVRRVSDFRRVTDSQKIVTNMNKIKTNITLNDSVNR